MSLLLKTFKRFIGIGMILVPLPFSGLAFIYVLQMRELNAALMVASLVFLLVQVVWYFGATLHYEKEVRFQAYLNERLKHVAMSDEEVEKQEAKYR